MHFSVFVIEFVTDFLLIFQKLETLIFYGVKVILVIFWTRSYVHCGSWYFAYRFCEVNHLFCSGYWTENCLY